MDWQNIISNIILLISVLVNAVLLFWYRMSVRKKEKSYDDELESMKQNKVNQLEKEKELKPMAKMLCDRCGKETSVKDAINWEAKGDNYFVCPPCFKILEASENKLADLRNQVETLEHRKEQL